MKKLSKVAARYGEMIRNGGFFFKLEKFNFQIKKTNVSELLVCFLFVHLLSVFTLSS
jgi:uncharacterized integral membrane protein